MAKYDILKNGDVSDNGQILIVDQDRLCYKVKSMSRGSVGIRTISKDLLDEYVQFFSNKSEANANDARDALSGNCDIDKYEYGYTSTLTVMAKMILAKKDLYIQNQSINTKPFNPTLQQIFYGAPGTGKSFKTNEIAKKYSTIRTTFHPDSDYSTFVGVYKPVMEECDVKVPPIVTNNDASLQPSGTYKEKRIVYKFVKQAFLKAYIEAWKKYVSRNIVNPIHHSFYVSSGIDLWILLKVDDSKVYYKKESRLPKDFYEAAVKKAWGTRLNNNNYHQLTACSWYDNNSADEEKTAESCWNAVWKELNTGRTIKSKPGSQQEYSISLEGDSIVVTAEGKGDGKGAAQDKIKKHFYSNDNDSDSSVQKAIAQKLKEYGEDFDKSWSQLKKEVEESLVPNTDSSEHQMVQPQFLIIEEINRGNCAQIFGDLFQLLDRKKGYSEYPIDADEDIRNCLLSEDTDEDPSFGKTGLQFTDEQKNAINAIYKKEGVPFRDVAGEIAKGKILVLPPNLFIWATMNTSDQSLFPIDSAFKRRWDWKYIPINTRKELWFIETENAKYSWSAFLEKINDIINEQTSSEDKQLGFYFCKAKDNIIDAETFVSKVVFYLWNDVFKDYGFDGDYFQDPDGGKLEFRKFFNFDGSINEKKVDSFMKNLNIETYDENNDDADNQGKGVMKVSFPNGTIVEGKTTVDVFMKTIDIVVKEHGIDEVKNAEI